MTKRTVLLLALAATTGMPTLVACSTAERQAPLPPQAAGSLGTGSTTIPGSGGVRSADGSPVPTSGSVGANVPPGPAGSSGGLRTRPGYVPGPAGTTPGGDSYRVGARAPWGILLDDRPVPQPGAGPVDPRQADPRQADPQQVGPPPVGPEQAPLPAPPSVDGAPGGGAIILAADRPVLAPRTVPVTRPLPPGQAKKLDVTTPPRALPDAVSFASLLSVLPPVADGPELTEAEPAGGDEKPETPPKQATAPDTEAEAEAGQDKPGRGDDSRETPSPAKPGPTPTAPSADLPVDLPVPSGAPDVPSAAPATSEPTPTPTPTQSATQPVPGSTKPEPSPALPATGWRTDGLRLVQPSADATGRGGSPAFRKALKATLGQRPTGDRPAPAALRAWSASLAKAAALAPDPRTKEQLRQVSRYAAQLAGTPAAKRAELQQDRPGMIRAAKQLRVSLPKRFGVDVLG